MGVFSRRGSSAPEPEVTPQAAVTERPRPQGPWDAADRPEPHEYLNFGGLRILPRDGMGLRLDVDESDGEVTSVTIQYAGSAVQLQAFAAPRSAGLWDEVRTEIATEISRQGGSADELPGSFGRELLAKIPMRSADGRSGFQPMRFAGIDGPRWFLRVVFHGDAVHDSQTAAALDDLVRDVVVVRGTHAMAPRELLPLKVPVSDTDDESSEAEQPDFNPFVRGPEITEVR